MSYAYTLLKWRNYNDPNDHTVELVEGPSEFQTLEDLKKAVETDIGFVPGWLVDCPLTEYVDVEDEQGDFVLQIEGAEIE